MAEHLEESEANTEQALGQASPAAVSLALGRTGRTGKAFDAKAAAFLDEQTTLIRLQTEHLHEQRELQTSRLRWGRYSDRMKAFLQTLTALVGLAVVGVISAMAWSAHEDHGLVIDAFSVPPDLARNGLTGEVVAARFLDKLQAMQTTTQSDRPASSFQNNWGSEIKVDIPETGLTFGDMEKLLRDKLGHATHVTGEVIRTPTGITVTARLGDASPQSYEGPESNIDALEQQAAEAVYRTSQPYRFGEYLEQHGRADEAFKVIAELAANGPPSERGWAYAQWASFDLNEHGDPVAARTHGLLALAQGGGSIVEAEIALVGEEVWSGQDEKVLGYSTDLQSKAQTRAPEQTQDYFNENRLLATGWLESLIGDEKRSAATFLAVEKQPDFQGIQKLSPALAATAFALDHDPPSARAAIALAPPLDGASLLQLDANNAFMALPAYWIAVEGGNWPVALAEARGANAWLDANKSARPLLGLLQPVWTHPLEALALARTGDVAGAQSLIATTPLDCYLCLRVRGQIAAEARDWPAADRWFTEAVRQAPSLPFAYADWGAMLLAKGDAEGAIAKLAVANEKSPNFADPLETWGEALMREGDFKDAVAKFREADKNAPKWGRNHMEWGQALARLGKADEARAQFEIANGLDLSKPDRAALNVLLARTASGPLHG